MIPNVGMLWEDCQFQGFQVRINILYYLHIITQTQQASALIYRNMSPPVNEPTNLLINKFRFPLFLKIMFYCIARVLDVGSTMCARKKSYQSGKSIAVAASNPISSYLIHTIWKDWNLIIQRYMDDHGVRMPPQYTEITFVKRHRFKLTAKSLAAASFRSILQVAFL